MPTKSTSSKHALVIVESPAKARTIQRYLGAGFRVQASMGHVRDLPAKSLGVDLENNFQPTYQIIPSRQKILTELRKLAKDSHTVFLAPDLDREGEAIAWHLAQALNLPADKIRRVVFNAITKSTIKQAFEHPASINLDKVNAQQARRILDRIVGYEISPLLWKKVARGLSAGRVQSVAVKLIVQREREIQAFIPEEYWKITAVFSPLAEKTTPPEPKLTSQYHEFLKSFEDDKGPSVKDKHAWLAEHNCIESHLASLDGKPFRPDNQDQALKIHSDLSGVSFQISDIQTKRTQSRPSAPFITSTLQQQGANRLGYSAKNTMRLAQQLYEGLEITGQGSVGLITYMRTDSTHLAPEAIQSARDFILDRFGSDYLPDKPQYYGTSNKSAQEAHEAIRPTDPTITPDQVKGDLTPQQHKLYQLIWNRFISCQMTPGQWDITTVSITAPTSAGPALFKTTGRKLIFDGFMKVAGLTVANGDQILPALESDQYVWPVDLSPSQHFTSPPPRYTEASLVKALEAQGIGRPSTYASIISTVQDRGYVEQLERKFHATDLGIVVTEKLDEHFPHIMDVTFTSHMEEQLDKIEDQHLDWLEVLNEFYQPFKESLELAHEQMAHAKAETQPSEYTCPDCKKPLVYRFGKNGRFLSCSAYPECKFAAPIDRDGKIAEPEKTDHKCPNCGGAMILRRGRFGSFLGCEKYPECKTTMKLDKEGNPLPPKAPPKPTGIRCHKCEKGELVIRDSKRGPFLGCNRFPRCRTIISMKQLDNLKQWQEQGTWPPASIEKADEMLGRKTAKSKATETDEGEPTAKKTKKKTVTKKKKAAVKETKPTRTKPKAD